ncbi:MAG TPA: hypothetical protein V6D17_14110, partial [Candidatus Obscuribacterales bacterium]
MTEAHSGAEITAFVTRIEAPEGVDTQVFTNWLVQLMMAGARFSGFWSGEMIAPHGKSREWSIIQRFSTEQCAVTWKQSIERQRLLEALRTHTNGVAPEIFEDISSGIETGGSVATAIITDVKPETEE